MLDIGLMIQSKRSRVKGLRFKDQDSGF